MPQREQPRQQYYPSARVRLIVRLEDYGADDTPEPPDLPTTVRAGRRDRGPVLNVEEEAGRLTLVAPGENPTASGTPQQQIASQDARTFVIDGVIPRNAQVMRNGIRTADTLSLEIQFRDMPIDPRAVRACAVEYFLGTIPAADFQRGIEGEIRSSSTSSGVGLPWNVVPDHWTDASGKQRSNLRFEGWVDSWQAMWSEGDAPIVRLECTDNTRLLLEQDAGPKLTVDPRLPLDRAFAEYLANYPQFRGLSIEYRPGGATVPVLEDALMKTKYRPKLGPAASGGSGQLKVWDYLTDVAGSIGHTLRMEGTTVVIQRVRTMYDARAFGRSDDPFIAMGGRELPSGRILPNRLYVYGRNIADMTFTRKFVAVAPQNVEVRSYDTGTKRTLVARFPLPGDRQKRLSPGESSDQVWKVKIVEGIRDEPTLRIIAQGIYEALTRNEIEAAFSTKNMGSLGGSNLDPDALDVLPGDAIDVEVLRSPYGEDDESTINEIQEAMTTRAAEFLEQLGFDPEFAAAYQLVIDNIGIQTTFRVRTLGLDWDAETEGVTLDFDCVNYIEVRADKDLDPSEQITVEQTAGQEPQRVIIEDEIG